MTAEGNAHRTRWADSPIWSVVNGPWRLKSYTEEGVVTFVPNQHYSGPNPAAARRVPADPDLVRRARSTSCCRAGRTDPGRLPALGPGRPSRMPTPPSAGPTRWATGTPLVPQVLFNVRYMHAELRPTPPLPATMLAQTVPPPGAAEQPGPGLRVAGHLPGLRLPPERAGAAAAGQRPGVAAPARRRRSAVRRRPGPAAARRRTAGTPASRPGVCVARHRPRRRPVWASRREPTLSLPAALRRGPARADPADGAVPRWTPARPASSCGCQEVYGSVLVAEDAPGPADAGRPAAVGDVLLERRLGLRPPDRRDPLPDRRRPQLRQLPRRHAPTS